jgi:hypothetical protein
VCSLQSHQVVPLVTRRLACAPAVLGLYSANPPYGARAPRIAFHTVAASLLSAVVAVLSQMLRHTMMLAGLLVHPRLAQVLGDTPEDARTARPAQVTSSSGSDR